MTSIDCASQAHLFQDYALCFLWPARTRSPVRLYPPDHIRTTSSRRVIPPSCVIAGIRIKVEGFSFPPIASFSPSPTISLTSSHRASLLPTQYPSNKCILSTRPPVVVPSPRLDALLHPFPVLVADALVDRRLPLQRYQHRHPIHSQPIRRRVGRRSAVRFLSLPPLFTRNHQCALLAGAQDHADEATDAPLRQLQCTGVGRETVSPLRWRRSNLLQRILACIIKAPQLYMQRSDSKAGPRMHRQGDDFYLRLHISSTANKLADA
ncbi:hypothetical protein C8R43DRAFT_237302 [Mycena crocata]|nr:hypothetical protein C8R43DRAFT_237302 [Mycena crocata]